MLGFIENAVFFNCFKFVVFLKLTHNCVNKLISVENISYVIVIYDSIFGIRNLKKGFM